MKISELEEKYANDVEGGESFPVIYAGKGYRMTLNELRKFMADISNGGGSTPAATQLSELTDVSLSDLVNGQSLVWDEASQKWINKMVQGGGGGGDTLYSMKLTGLESNYSFTTAAEKMEISVGFESKVKEAGSDVYEPFNESAIFSVEIYKGTAATIISSGNIVQNGEKFIFDLKPYLVNGDNAIVVRAIGVLSSKEGIASTTVGLTSMSLSPFNFNWHSPFIEGKEYRLGGLNILGSLDKMLHIMVTGDDYVKGYEIPLGTYQYDSTNPYYWDDMEHPSETGVYTVEIWLTGTKMNVVSDVLTYNIMCVASEDEDTAQLVCMNNAATEIDNYMESKLFSYAIYNGGASTGRPTITVSVGSSTVISNTLTVSHNTPYDFSYAFAIATTQPTENITAKVEYGNVETTVITLKNETSFAPVAGYTHYFDAATRSNEEANRTFFVNEEDGSEIAATWNEMAWVEGMDGWTTDEVGNRCLLLPARSKTTVSLAPMKDLSTMTIVMYYKVKNAADYNEDIITIASNTVSSWMGVKVKPTNVLLHSQSLFADDLKQGYNTKDEEMVHLAITIVRNYDNIGNVAMIYVNGVKKCSFEWSTGDTFAHNGLLQLGSNTADLYFYKMFIYNRQFSWQNVLQSYYFCINSVAEKVLVKRKEDSVLNDRNEIDYDKVIGVYNTFVVELPKGAELPNKLTNPSNNAIKGSNLYINIVQDPTCSINGEWLDVPLEGQGTTAMTYLRWNLRSKTSEAYNKFRITAKKNVASSMHSHKRGSTSMYNDLYQIIVGANEANGRMAIYQYPVYGFQKIENEDSPNTYRYEFIGMYTIGPDKGDKSTFGFDNKTFKKTLIHMEGTDHSPVGVGYDYPWEELTVGINSEGDAFIGAKNAEGGLAQEAWEIGACADLEDAVEMKAYLDVEYAPAYKLDYECTPMIVGLPSGTSMDEINADVASFRAQDAGYNGFSNADCLIYIDGEHDTYYFNINTNTYQKDGRKVYDGLEGYGFSLATLESKSSVLEKTQYIRVCRGVRYKAEMEQYWLLNDSLFHACFLDLIGATDNEKKNTYPLKFGTLASGSRWRHRQDDLDTMADINNQGSADKKYSIMNTDKGSDGKMIYRGNSSYHWRNIREYYKDEMKTMMQRIFTEMVKLCPSGYGTSDIQKLVGCIRKYFWDYAQEYFTRGAYNLDAKWTYEDTWRIYKTNSNVNAVHPLTQSLGSHYEAEVAWFTLRMLFLASMNEWGAFVHYDDVSEGQVAFRQGADFEFVLTPAIDMKPSVVVGSNSAIKYADGRIMAGETVRIPVSASSDADTMVHVQGADWMRDVGDFSTLKLGSSGRTLSVTSKRLQTLKVGDSDPSKVTTNMTGLELGACPSLTMIDARNVVNMNGEIDLSKCPRLRTARFGGTSATVIQLPTGSKITTFNVPDTLQRLTLRDLPLLTKDGLTFNQLNALAFLRVENNKKFDGYDVLKTAFDGGSPLNNIRVIGFDKQGDATDVTLLATLTNGNYHGISEAGEADNSILPVLEGKLTVDGYVYENDYRLLMDSYENKVTISTKGFYMNFADPEVERVLVAKGVGDGFAVPVENAAALNGIGTWFKDNTFITSFDELKLFTRVTGLSANAFANCSNLESIDISNISILLGGIFNYCTSLNTLNIGDIVKIDASAFSHCKALTMNFNLPNLSGTLGDSAFYDSGITSIIAPNVYKLDSSSFYACKNLVNVDLQNVKEMGSQVFRDCTSLKSIALNNVESSGRRMFYGSTNLERAELNSILEIPSEAFYSCENLKYVSALSAKKIGSSAFLGCNLLETASFGTVESIAEYAFYNCYLLKEINLNLENVISIGSYAFYGCRELSIDVNLQKLNSEVGSYSFYQTKIKTLVAPYITSIGERAFLYCKSLHHIDIGSENNALTSIGTFAFSDNYNLDVFICRTTIPPTLTSEILRDSKVCPIYVPDESVEAYKTANIWRIYASRINPLSEYVE